MKSHTQDTKTYDLAIIGTGAAGYTASIYASRYKLTNIIIGEMMGGQTAEAHLIQNFPTYEEIPGAELMMKMKAHAEAYNVPIEFDRVEAIDGKTGDFTITTAGGKELNARSILLAVGTKRKKLGIPNEGKFFGKGITYCATCDAVFYKDKVVVIVGGSDAANTASLYLATLANKVYQVYRGDKLRGEVAWADQVMKNKDIEVIFNTTITEALGSDKLEAVMLDKPYKGSQKLETDGLFIEIGSEPDTSLMKHLDIEMDDRGYIKVGDDQKTSVPGIWAAGDITTGSNSFHQTITAAAEGAIAAENVFSTLQARE